MALDTVRAALAGDWFDRFARVGYAAKGVIWGIVGLLAIRVALGSFNDEADFEGAIEMVSEQPLHALLLVLLALGLFAYAGWRLVQGLLDVEGEGSDAKGWLKRGLYVTIGLTYGALAVFAAGVLGGWSREDGHVQDWTARVLALPFGTWLVGLAGAAILIAALGELYFAMSRRYAAELGGDEIGGFQRACILCTGGLGHVARGVVYGAVGLFAIRAAVEFDPDEARGLADTFRELADQPYGVWIVGFMAAGFIAFGLYCLLLAFHRHIPNEGLIRGRGS